VPAESRLIAIQSSLKALSRLLMVVRIFAGSLSKQWMAR
jgi:hypothetical protein